MENFKDWMKKVDLKIEQFTGLTSEDLPDCPYRDWWEDDYTISDAAKKAIRMAQE